MKSEKEQGPDLRALKAQVRICHVSWWMGTMEGSKQGNHRTELNASRSLWLQSEG